MVYLSEAYAPYFGVMSCGEGKAVIFEVAADTLPQELFYPDEDFVAQAMRSETGEPLELIHEEVREALLHYQMFAADSLRHLGNVAYRGFIPPSAITRYCIFDPKENYAAAMAAADPCISLLNYRFVGSKYRSLTAWLFGDRPDWELGFGSNEEWLRMMSQSDPRAREQFEQAFANRAGVTVHQGAGA